MADPITFARPSVTDADVDAVTRVLRSGWLTTGKESAAFEEELADYLGASHVVAVASCTHALELLLASQGLHAGARVGVPTWTFVSSALSAVHQGLQPVLLDVEAGSLNICPDSLADAIDDLDAVIGVHFGGTAFSHEINKLCEDRGIPLIEDAAHALGTRGANGLIAGHDSAGAAYSFYATKNLSSGEGGAIATDDEAIADFARDHRLHGLSRDAWKRYLPDGEPLYDLVGAGWKMNFPDLLAALARSQLARFDEMQAARREIVERYRANLAGSSVTFVPATLDPGSADHLLVVLLPEGISRSDVVQQLSVDGIGTSVHFQPLHRFRWMQDNVDIGPGGVQTAEALADRTLSLPLYPDLTHDQVDRVCDRLVHAVGLHG